MDSILGHHSQRYHWWAQKNDSLIHPFILSLELYSWTLQSPFIHHLWWTLTIYKDLSNRWWIKHSWRRRLFFPLIQECQIRCLLSYFHQNMCVCVCVCVCVNLKKRLSTKIRNLYFLKLDKFTTFPLFVTIFEAYKVS